MDWNKEEKKEPVKKPKKKKKLKEIKVLQEPKVSEVARERARIAAERNAHVKAK